MRKQSCGIVGLLLDSVVCAMHVALPVKRADAQRPTCSHGQQISLCHALAALLQERLHLSLHSRSRSSTNTTMTHSVSNKDNCYR